MPILMVKVNTSNVPDSPGRWLAGQVVAAVADEHTFGTQEVPSAGNFYHISITDKTLEEVQEYLQDWKHNPTTTQISNQGNTRLLQVTSDMVSATGKNAFTQEGVESLIDYLNEEYPTANASYDSHTNTAFRFYVTVPQSGRDTLIEIVNDFVREMQYGRRRWYINSAGMTFLGSNGGAISGTAAQVAGYLRDGLLD